MRKAQASLEFLQVLALFFIVITIFSSLFYTYIIDLSKKNRQAELDNFVKDIATEVNKAYLAGDGYQSKFYLTDRFKGNDYNITLNSSERIIEVQLNEPEWFSSSRLITSKVRAVQWSKGGNVTVENAGGWVIIK